MKRTTNAKMTVPELYEATEIVEKMGVAAEILASCIIAEPHSYHLIFEMMEDAMIKALDPTLIFTKIIETAKMLYTDTKQYSALSISTRAALKYTEVVKIGQKHTETSLEIAFQNFFDVYGMYTEAQIAAATLHKISEGDTSNDIRLFQDNYRREAGLNIMAKESSGIEVFEKMLIDAYDGKEPHFPVKPFLPSIRAHIPYIEYEDYMVVAGRSGMGKSYYAFNQAFWCAENGIPCTYVNLEMSAATVYKRLWQMRTESRFHWNMKDSTDDKINAGFEALEWLKKSSLKIVSPGRKMSNIISAMRQSRYEYGTELFIIDYIQMIQDAGRGLIKTYELENIVYSTKEEGKMLRTPIMAMAQLLRDVDRSGDKRPKNADLKDTAALENAATIIAMLYRPEYYEIYEDELGNKYPPDYAEVLITKGRDSGLGNIKCRFNHIKGFYSEFSNTEITGSPPAQAFPAYAPTSRNDEDVPF